MYIYILNALLDDKLSYMNSLTNIIDNEKIPQVRFCRFSRKTALVVNLLNNEDFLWFLPILDLHFVVDETIQGILYEQQRIIIPKQLSLMIFLKHNSVWAKCSDVFGGNKMLTTLIGRAKDEATA